MPAFAQSASMRPHLLKTDWKVCACEEQSAMFVVKKAALDPSSFSRDSLRLMSARATFQPLEMRLRDMASPMLDCSYES